MARVRSPISPTRAISFCQTPAEENMFHVKDEKYYI
jgi:hypothetical protein